MPRLAPPFYGHLYIPYDGESDVPALRSSDIPHQSGGYISRSIICRPL